ncbi:sensor histidine kinase [Sphingomonas koreensis]|nr:two-component system C4-dicarboxylate transport sensor histidine kinase DctB [Sphingomonas koreensis]RSU62783.1 sensor histidine kinase [Sphingomonas koreensis]RSU71492.1 sensor histidine kinase [Sphingomonas koreensis]
MKSVTRSTRSLVLLAAAGAVLLALITILAFRVAQQQAVSATDRAAAQLARDNAGLFASELQKFRLLPLVLAEYPDVRAMLETRDTAVAERINARLELLAQRTDAAAIYVLTAQGRAIAASNYRLPASFVGQDYGFRPYFQGAVRDGGAELFALGTVSGRPGLYLARRIGDAARPLGVIVVKIEFEAMQAAWARQQGRTLVTDPHGVVIVTSEPRWRFGTIGRLGADDRAAIRATRQYGSLPLDPLPLTIDGADARMGGETPGNRLATMQIPLAGAQMRVLYPLDPAMRSANANARLVSLGALFAIAGALLLLWRARERRLIQIAAQRALEGQVAERTAELRETNAQLVAESSERALADQRYRAAREELAQANRLGSLGQITAGVAHEINQPVAAIRSFAENAQGFLARGDSGRADENLGRIVDLTQRIGTITAELRNFARRRTPETGAVDVDAVIESTLLLIGDRVRAQGVVLERTGPAGLHVTADRVRLEQILINLIQNALDALAGQKAPVIRIVTARTDARIMIEVADNGLGVAPELAGELFMPFVTGRAEGLGLGLPIARNIAREFGGELSPIPSPLGGAAFRLELPEAGHG